MSEKTNKQCDGMTAETDTPISNGKATYLYTKRKLKMEMHPRHSY